MAVTFTQARKSTCNLGELVSFSGGYSPIDTSGLMPFEGTLTLMAKDRSGFCWGTKVTISVEGMDDPWLPELYVKSVSPLDIKNGQISVNVGCVISLLANKTFDDFKTEADFLFDSTATEGDMPKIIRYWWQQWELINPDGSVVENPDESAIQKDVSINSIVQEMCRHLKVSCSGGVSGKKRLPYTPSGNILTEIGTLIFNSSSPSYAYSDHRGGIRITSIDFTPNNGFSITLGESTLDKDYSPVDSGMEPIKRLIVNYSVPELEDSCNKSVQRCYDSTEILPAFVITGNGDDQYDLDVEKTTTCEWVECGVSGDVVSYFGIGEANIKAIKVTKQTRPAYLFPGRPPEIFESNYVDSYIEVTNQYYDTKEGLLIGEATWIQEPIGIVYGSWISSHEQWDLGDQTIGGTGSSSDNFPNNIAVGINAFYPAVLPTGRAATNRFNTTLTDSKYTETKYFYNDWQVLTGKVTTEWRPISAVLTSYNGGSFNGNGEAYFDFEIPPENKSQYAQYSFEILEKDGWVDLKQVYAPDSTKPNELRAVFNVWGRGDGVNMGAFSGATVKTSITTEIWDFSCTGETKHQLEEKVLAAEYMDEIEENLRSKYAEPINVVLNVTTYTKVAIPGKPATPTSPAVPGIPAGGVKSRSKTTQSTDTPNKFKTVLMWGTKQEAFDEYLRINNIDEYTAPGGTPIPNTWTLVGGTEGYILNYNNYDVIPNFVPRADLLKLVTRRTITKSSTGGGESPASSEFLSCSLNDIAKWKDKPGVITKDGFLCFTGKYDPPTEVMDLGRVYDISDAEKLASTIMKLRQAQAIQYELICKLDPTVCGFPPVRTIRVKESCQTNASLVFIGNSLGVEISGTEVLCTWDLWQIGYTPGPDSPGWVFPPADAIIDVGGSSALVVAPAPSYVVVDNNYSGSGVITIGNDTLQGSITYTPNYIDVSTTNYTSGTWATITNVATGDTISSWVENGKIEVPDEFSGDVIISIGTDTLAGTVTDVPNRIDLPLGYYPSENIFIDDTVPASIQTDQTTPIYIQNPVYVDGDDTIVSSFSEVITSGLARLKVQSHFEYLSYGLNARKVMVRGD